MGVIFIWARECPLGCEKTRRTTNFHHSKSCDVYLGLAARHFHALYRCFKYLQSSKCVKSRQLRMANLLIKMSYILLDFEKKALDFKLKIIEPFLPFINQQGSLESEIAVPSIYIPYPTLMKWHELVGMKDDRGTELDYVDLPNLWIPGQWFKLTGEIKYPRKIEPWSRFSGEEILWKESWTLESMGISAWTTGVKCLGFLVIRSWKRAAYDQTGHTSRSGQFEQGQISVRPDLTKRKRFRTAIIQEIYMTIRPPGGYSLISAIRGRAAG